MQVDILGPELTGAYDRYLVTQPASLFYYSTKYKNFLKDLLNCEEQYLIATQNGDIVGILPLMIARNEQGLVYNSLPYYGSNGGILTVMAEAHTVLCEAYTSLIKRPEVLASTIVGNPLEQRFRPSVLHNYTDYRIGQWTSLECDHDPWEALFSRIDSSTRRNIKKAINEQIVVKIDHTQIDRLRQLHQANIKTIGGLPKTDTFFALITKHFAPGEDFDLYVAKKNDRVIAALLIFYFNKTVEYYTPTIDHEFRSSQPLSLILVHAMSDASRRGFKWWNWGGTWQSQTGVYRFKKKWAAVDHHYDYYIYLNDTTILEWDPAQILERFPGFFVVPFSELKIGATR